jgi:hypothetical protein
MSNWISVFRRLKTVAERIKKGRHPLRHRPLEIQQLSVTAAPIGSAGRTSFGGAEVQTTIQFETGYNKVHLDWSGFFHQVFVN